MQEVIENQKSLLLDSVHRDAHAAMIARDGWLVPESYGDPAAEYAAVRNEGAGLLDLSPSGRIVVSGSEAVQFLNGLISNDMKTLGVHQWMWAALPNVQGRILAALRVARLQDDDAGPKFLIDTEASTKEIVYKNLQRFTLAGDFHVEDLTDNSVMFSLMGPRASELVAQVLWDAGGELPANGLAEFDSHIVLRSALDSNGFDLIEDSGGARLLWTSLIGAGARPVGYQTFDTLRIEAGIPRFGVDMDETNVVTETSLDDAVSYTKGCYVGQEIIARIKYRGHVAKKLRGLRFQTRIAMDAGSTVTSADGREIGRITSATFSPKLNCTIALAYLKYDFIEAGTNVMANSQAAEVSSLPFEGIA